MLSNILDLFGENVKEIFIFMLTFCDSGKPNIIEPLQEKNCHFSKIIQSYKNNNWYYKFNNSAIFEDNRSDEFTKMFWKLGMKNFSDFKNKLKTLPRKSLTLSKTILAQRKYLEDKIQILYRKLNVGLNKIEEIKGIMKIILNLKGDLNDSKIFTKIILEDKVISLEDLKKRYNYSKSQISLKRQLFLGAREELININIQCLETLDKINNSTNLLNEISFNKSVFESAEKHIDLLIEVEQLEHKPGWQNRIRGLKLLKAENKMLRECYNGENKQMNQIKDFVEKEINKYCDIDLDNLDNEEFKE